VACIGIHAIAYHQYLLSDFCRILREHELVVFTTSSELAELETTDPALDIRKVIQKDEGESWSDYFDRIDAESELLDALVVLTARGPPAARIELLTFDPDCPMLAWMHVANEFIHAPDVGFASKVSSSISRLSSIPYSKRIAGRVYKLFEGATRPYPLINADAVFVSYGPLREQLQTSDWPTPVYVLYPALYDDETNAESNDELHVTVPGKINQTYRDYESFLSELDRIWSPTNESLKITLLGGGITADESLRKRCQELAATRNLEWYPDEEWVPQTEFEKVLAETDLLCSPIQQSVPAKLRGYPPERYGFTKATGIVLDAVRHGQPVLVPSWFPLDEIVGNLVYVCDESESIPETLIELSRGATVETWKRDAVENAKLFTYEKQKCRFNRVIEKLTQI